MEEPNFSLLQRTFITPASPSLHRSIFLSAVDILFQNLSYNRRVLFFRIRPQDYSPKVEKLKSSLARVLVDFYPLAGRLGVGEDGRLEVVCNDLGAEFVEATVNGVEFSDLEGENFDMNPLFVQFTRLATFSPDDKYSAPLLLIQVTRFNCGSIALGVAHSHVLADGQSLWHFMTSWAECARGVAMSLGPIHSRSLLRVDNPSEKKALFCIQDNQDEHTSGELEVDGAQPLKTQKVFRFSKEMIRSLKERATMEGGDAPQFSSYEVLCAHIWKCVCRAWGHAKDKRIMLIHAVNMRRKMQPPLPDGYFGNAIMAATASALACELEVEPLACTALRIHSGLARCTSEAMEGHLHMLEVYGPSAFLRRVSSIGVCMRVTGSPKFPIYNTDFGWGKPLAVRVASMGDPGHIVLDPSSYGLVDVSMALPLSTMCRLKLDPTLTHDLSSSLT